MPLKAMNKMLNEFAVVVRSRKVRVIALVIKPTPNKANAVSNRLEKNRGMLKADSRKPKRRAMTKTATKSMEELIMAAVIAPAICARRLIGVMNVASIVPIVRSQNMTLPTTKAAEKTKT